MVSIDKAAATLAACDHPEEQIRNLRTMDGRSVRRCCDCGAVCYRETSGWTAWTRPVLVAHVCGAVRNAAHG